VVAVFDQYFERLMHQRSKRTVVANDRFIDVKEDIHVLSIVCARNARVRSCESDGG
jgi:hypothetical protein